MRIWYNTKMTEPNPTCTTPDPPRLTVQQFDGQYWVFLHGTAYRPATADEVLEHAPEFQHSGLPEIWQDSGVEACKKIAEASPFNRRWDDVAQDGSVE